MDINVCSRNTKGSTVHLQYTYFAGKKMIAAIDSSSDESSKSNSPWLSKANGIKTGAGVTAEK